jgi:hypothetical protein
MKQRYIIVTGYYGDKDDTYRQELFKIWYKNTMYHTRKNPPVAIFVINANGYMPKDQRKGTWIDIPYNLGHVCDTMAIGSMPYKHGLCGWTMGTLIGALLAFNSNADMVYKEQDCLAFGPWVEEIYKTLGNKIKIVTGKLDPALPFKIEQSLFAVKYEYLIDFVRTYISITIPDWEMVPEHKWERLIQTQWKDRFEFLPFGYGRDRPINYDDKVWYMQHDPVNRKILEPEFKELRKRKLI